MKKPEENLQIAKALHQTAAELRREAEALIEQARELRMKVERRWRIARPPNDNNGRKETVSQN